MENGLILRHWPLMKSLKILLVPKELSGICRRLGIEYRGTKQELNHHIEEYFCGKLAERKDVPRLSKKYLI